MRRLQEALLLDPKAGAVIRGIGGIRKIRFAYDNKEKSGSIRVIIYIDFEQYGKTFLLTAYPKNEKENLSMAERNELFRLAAALEAHVKKIRGKT